MQRVLNRWEMQIRYRLAVSKTALTQHNESGQEAARANGRNGSVMAGKGGKQSLARNGVIRVAKSPSRHLDCNNPFILNNNSATRRLLLSVARGLNDHKD